MAPATTRVRIADDAHPMSPRRLRAGRKEIDMVRLQDKETGADLGTIDDEQFRFMMDQLVEESDDDQDYYINQATLELFEEEGADPELLAVLTRALGARDEMEIRWSEA
jgi:hypothetical protein